MRKLIVANVISVELSFLHPAIGEEEGVTDSNIYCANTISATPSLVLPAIGRGKGENVMIRQFDNVEIGKCENEKWRSGDWNFIEFNNSVLSRRD